MEMENVPWRRPLLVEGTTVHKEALPSKDELLVALCGKRGRGPLCNEARSLARLHQRRREHTASASEIDDGRAESMARIDSWVAHHIPRPHRNARTHSETVGALIDRMAAAADRAMHALITDGPSSLTVHTAWVRLAELEIQYGDLAGEICDGRRRLPPPTHRLRTDPRS